MIDEDMLKDDEHSQFSNKNISKVFIIHLQFQTSFANEDQIFNCD